MPESLLSPSQVKLFGREFGGLRLVPPAAQEANPNPPTVDAARAADKETIAARKSAGEAGSLPEPGDPPSPSAEFDLLTNQLLREGATLARIYGFTYEGQHVTLPSPTLFLVHGPGRAVTRELSGPSGVSGVATRDWAFEEDVRYWEYDRVNYALRLDMVSGTLDDILIQACIDAGLVASERSRGTDLVSRGTDLVSRGTDMVSRGTDLVSRSRHRMG